VQTDRPIPNNKPDIIIREYPEIQRLYNRNTSHVECKNKSDTGNNRGDWNHFKTTQTVPEQHTGKARNQGTTDNSHIGHCTQTAGSADVTVKGKAVPLQAWTGPDGS